MELIFYYFLKNSVDDTELSTPICTDKYLGEIGDYCEIDGVGYYITDYTVEQHFLDEYKYEY